MRRLLTAWVFASVVAVGTACTSPTDHATVGGRRAPPSAPRPLTSIDMPSPGSVEVAFGSVWVTNGPAQTVTRIDPRRGVVIATIATPDAASVVAAGAGLIWVTSFPGNSLTRIDPGTNQVTRTVRLAPRGAGPIGVTVFDGFVWVANHDGEPTSSVAKIEPTTMRVVDVIPVGGQSEAGPVWISSGAGSIWTDVTGSHNVVVRIDPRTDRILATVDARGACTQLAADDTAVWGASGDDCPPGVSRIDPRTNRVTATFDEGGSADAVSLDGDSLWYGTTVTRKLGRIDAKTGRVSCLVELPGPAFGMAAGAGAVWVTDKFDGKLFEVRPALACPPGK